MTVTVCITVLLTAVDDIWTLNLRDSPTIHSPRLMYLDKDTSLLTRELFDRSSVTYSSDEKKTNCNNALRVLNGGTVNTKHLRGSNKEAMMTYYYSGRVLAATATELFRAR